MSKSFYFRTGAVLLVLSLVTLSLWAQNVKGRRNPAGQGGNGGEGGQIGEGGGGIQGGGIGGRGGAGGGGRGSKEKYVAPITDEKLLKLHNEFITKAEKLANDYSKSKDPDKAKIVYEQILKLNPKHEGALAGIAKFKEKEESANKKVIEILANKSFQETGVFTVPGKPFKIEASGTWNLMLSETLGPKGFEIPKELRDFNLGSLVGYIDTGDPESSKPFLIGEEYEDVGPSKPGQIKLACWDSDPSDNKGRMHVTIKGTFETNKKGGGGGAAAGQ